MLVAERWRLLVAVGHSRDGHCMRILRSKLINAREGRRVPVDRLQVDVRLIYNDVHGKQERRWVEIGHVARTGAGMK